MIWCQIFLLTISIGIASSKYRHLREVSRFANIDIDVPKYAFENDIVKISCSRNITDTDPKFIRLIVGSWEVARSFENARPKVYDKDITVMPGSNGTHLSATLKAQCKYHQQLWCDSPRFIIVVYKNDRAQASPFVRPPFLRVLKKVTDLQVFAPNDVCAAGDQKAKKVCRTCEKIVQQTGKTSTVTCGAGVPAKVGGVYRFDWDITANGIAVNGDWITTPSKSYSVDGPAWTYYPTGVCLPLKMVSSSVQIPVQTNVTFAVKCVLTFNVGNLSQTKMATTKLCIKNDSDIAKLGSSTTTSKKRDYKTIVLLFLILASLLGGFIIAGVFFNKRLKTSQKEEDNCSDGDAQYSQNNTSQIQTELTTYKESFSGSRELLSRSKRSLSRSKPSRSRHIQSCRIRNERSLTRKGRSRSKGTLTQTNKISLIY